MRSSWLQLEKRALSRKLRTRETGALGGLEEKIISCGDYFNDRRTFVSLETSDSVDEKRYKWSDRSELAKVKNLSLRARGGKNNLLWRLF